MITSIELGDFLSHSETKLEFGNGVTVFVGQNGAGKSPAALYHGHAGVLDLRYARLPERRAAGMPLLRQKDQCLDPRDGLLPARFQLQPREKGRARREKALS